MQLDNKQAQVLLDALELFGPTDYADMTEVIDWLDDIAVGREPEQDEPEQEEPERRRGVKPGSPNIGTGPLHITGSGRALGPSALRRA